MLDTNFLRHLKRMSLLIEKKVTSNYTGEHESLQTGQGIVFSDHRMYTPGDDYKYIDWKLFARTDKLHVKKFEEERALVVHIIVDYSASMNYGEKTKKYEYAAMLALGFAYMALRHNERFVLSTFSDHLEVFKPKRGARQLVAILDHLRQKKPGGVSNFEGSLVEYQKYLKNRSLIVVVSDFLYDVDEVKRALLGFKQHEVLLIQVLDPIEKNLNLKGEFKLKDVETRGLLRTFIGPILQRSYSERLKDHQARLNNIAAQVKGKFYSVTTDVDIFDTFYAVLQE